MLPSEIAKLTPEEFQAQLPQLTDQQRDECVGRVKELVAVKQNGRPALTNEEIWRGFLGLMQCALAARGRR